MGISRQAAFQVWPISNVNYLWVLPYEAGVGIAFILGTPHDLRTAEWGAGAPLPLAQSQP